MSIDEAPPSPPPPPSPGVAAVDPGPVGGPAGTSRPSSTRPIEAGAESLRGPTTIDHVRRVLGVVTGTGWTVVLLAVGAWIAGWRLGWLELSYIATASLVVLVASIPFVLGRSPLEVELELQPQRVVVGDRSAGQVTVRNRTGRRVLGQRLELTVGTGVAELMVPSLGGGGEHEELFVLPTQRRAVIPVGPATLIRDDPLGVLRRSAARTTPIPLFVHPRTVPLANLGPGLMRDLEGQPTADLSPSDIAFHALRDYETGDDRRFVHWLTTARVGKLMVRQFTDTRRAHLAVVLDGAKGAYVAGDGGPDAEFEVAVSVAASIGARALGDDQDVTMWGSGRLVPTVNPRVMLDTLAGLEHAGRHSQLADQIDLLMRRSNGISSAIVVTGSKPTIADLRGLVIRFPVDVRTMVIRVAVDETPGFRPIGSTMVLTLATLSDLGHLLWAVTRA